MSPLDIKSGTPARTLRQRPLRDLLALLSPIAAGAILVGAYSSSFYSSSSTSTSLFQSQKKLAQTTEADVQQHASSPSRNAKESFSEPMSSIVSSLRSPFHATMPMAAHAFLGLAWALSSSLVRESQKQDTGGSDGITKEAQKNKSATYAVYSITAAMWSVTALLVTADENLRLSRSTYRALARCLLQQEPHPNSSQRKPTDPWDEISSDAAGRVLIALLSGSQRRRDDLLITPGVGEALVKATANCHQSEKRPYLRKSTIFDDLKKVILSESAESALDVVQIETEDETETLDMILFQISEGSHDDAGLAAWLLAAWFRGKRRNALLENNLLLSCERDKSLNILRVLRKRIDKLTDENLSFSGLSIENQKVVRMILLAATELAEDFNNEEEINLLLQRAIRAGIVDNAELSGTTTEREEMKIAALRFVEKVAPLASHGQRDALLSLSQKKWPQLYSESNDYLKALFASLTSCAKTAAHIRSKEILDDDPLESDAVKPSRIFPERGAKTCAEALAQFATRHTDSNVRRSASRAAQAIVVAADDDGPTALAVWTSVLIKTILKDMKKADVNIDYSQIESVVLGSVKAMETEVFREQSIPSSVVSITNVDVGPIPDTIKEILPSQIFPEPEKTAGNHDSIPSSSSADSEMKRNITKSEGSGQSIARALRSLCVLVSNDERTQFKLLNSLEILPLLESLATYKWSTLEEESSIKRVISRLLAIIAAIESGANAIDCTKNDSKSNVIHDENNEWSWNDWLEDVASHSEDRKLRSNARRALLNAESTLMNTRNTNAKAKKFAVYHDGIHLMDPNDERHRLLCLGQHHCPSTPSSKEDEESHSDPMFDIVFIHGLLGRPFQSWRVYTGPQTESPPSTRSRDEKLDRHDSGARIDQRKQSQWSSASLEGNLQDTYWPAEWLQRDISNARMLSVSYKTNFSQWEGPSHDLTILSKTLLPSLRAAGIGDRPIIFVTHSLGGLLTKQMLSDAASVDDKVSLDFPNGDGSNDFRVSSSDTQKQLVSIKDILKMTRGIMFYSCPHFGSPLLKYLVPGLHQLLLPSAQLLDLRYQSPHLSDLNAKLSKLQKAHNISIMSLAEGTKTPLTEVWNGSNVTLSVDIVPLESSYPGYGDFYKLQGVDHVNTCKPARRTSDAYIHLITLLQGSGVISNKVADAIKDGMYRDEC